MRGLSLEVVPVDRPQEAAEDLPIVITATTSSTPVFDGSWLSEGTVVCAVGANALSRAEIDATTVRRADIVVCDSVAACQARQATLPTRSKKGSSTGGGPSIWPTSRLGEPWDARAPAVSRSSNP